MNTTRKYDFVIFGANGFTGSHVVKEVQRVSELETLTWAVAGLHKKELLKVLKQGDESEKEPTTDVIIADVYDYQSLSAMCRRSKVILDCVGPYRFWGEPVVKACVETGTDYVDVCGEPQFLEEMVLKYNKLAADRGVYIVGSCGSVGLTDLCVNFAEKNFQGTLNAVRAYTELFFGPDGAVFHSPTYDSAVHGFADIKALRKIRRALGYETLPLVGPKQKLEGLIHYSRELNKYAIPFIGAEVSVVRRTQRYLYETSGKPPLQYAMYGGPKNLWCLAMIVFYTLLVAFLAKIPPVKPILLQHPELFSNGVFSHEGPTKEQMEQEAFSVTMFGEGYSSASSLYERHDKPDKRITVRMSGPEPAYYSTSVLMVQAALTLVKERSNLPPQGGVFTPGAVFYNTNIIDNLKKHGIKFELLNLPASKL